MACHVVYQQFMTVCLTVCLLCWGDGSMTAVTLSKAEKSCFE